ncbi:dephospho-CoA kinase [Desulfitobacterium metallireducens]|uniref:Dephospho-CoA kinase n=1 Tax=Desulfitobacterium metallireducens DSM 15288 TaxID=871968 RepID=W0EAK8_9FIRM|nr:dephospho-CoA kinase [Desulfitobacterium metallireducens]AHF06568.1 dephospho-CoA kinase [Desulfitobacterium metallireducens DSM 15288]
MRVIGLTGGIGSGKSSVASWLKEHNISVLDADQTVHQLLAEDQTTISRVAQTFGDDILDSQGKIDRKGLGAKIFRNDEARKRLEGILHPLVRGKLFSDQMALAAAGVKVCVWDVPLLFEAGFNTAMDEVWVVWVSPQVQLERVMKRDSFTRAEAELRISAQWSLEDKTKLADVLIDNSGTWENTVDQLEELLVRIKDRVSL